MKIIIVGAGEFGKNLAATFCNDKHDVIIIDLSVKILQRIQNQLDVMTVAGSGSSIEVLKEAEVDKANFLIAVSNDDHANILACQIAKHFGVDNTVCRLSATECFSDKDNFTPDKLGIDYVVVPEQECVQKILNVLDYRSVLEKITFSNPDALMTALVILPSSLVAGVKISDFPDRELLGSVRFSAIVRNHEMIIPHGNTIIAPGDELYIAGPRDKVNAMVEWINPNDLKISKVIIAGGSLIGRELAGELARLRYDVRLIESDHKAGEEILDELADEIMVINGDPTDGEVLDEAGIGNCDAFVSALKEDEANMLSCILAKRHGAKKVISITNKSEYIYIVPTMKMIDCGFSTRLVASNSVLRNPISGTLSIDAILHRVNAYVFEFKVTGDSAVCNKKIIKCKCPESAVFSLVIRNNEVMTAAADLALIPGDIVVAIATPDTAKLLQPLFVKQSLLPW